jgi:hypothetical protein
VQHKLIWSQANQQQSNCKELAFSTSVDHRMMCNQRDSMIKNDIQWLLQPLSQLLQNNQAQGIDGTHKQIKQQSSTEVVVGQESCSPRVAHIIKMPQSAAFNSYHQACNVKMKELLILRC